MPIVFEMSGDVGGISKTVVYKGNRIDLGGHRFFTKSDRVLAWWLKLLPMDDPEQRDSVMLVRTRVSRIYFLRAFFEYPITLTPETLFKLGFGKAFRIAFSYLRSLLFPIKPVENIEHLMINRFGRELYNTFFKSYTEKVWGVSCDQISADWGLQRIKDLSIAKAVLHFLTQRFRRGGGIRQKETSTSLIEQFMYPKLGPGQLWEEAARVITDKGGEILFHHRVMAIHAEGARVIGVTAVDQRSGESLSFPADYVFSTMPIKELIHVLDAPVPDEVRRVADGLQYRDLMVVGLLVRRLKIGDVPDTWIYIQEPEVKLGRMQIFNNWSRYMVADPERTLWLGLEYFCNEGDELWRKSNKEFLAFAVDELAAIDIIDKEDVLDGVVLRAPKTYPAYVGAYEQFPVVRAYLDAFENLFLVGRNGMHRYNNQDHSMLTAMTAVDNILAGITGKDNIWDVNTEQEYHETR